MVLICSIAFLASLSSTSNQQYNEQFFVAKSVQLRLAVLGATPGFFNMPGNGEHRYRYLSDPPRSAVYFPDCYFYFNHTNGQLIMVRGSGEIDSPPPGPASIGTTQASAIALNLATILEGPAERIAHVFPTQGGNNDLIEYIVNIMPAHQGVSFAGSDFGSRAVIEHSTGKILSYGTAGLPPCLPPLSMTPAVSMVEAEATVASHVGNIADPPPVVLLDSTNLVIFKPDEVLAGPNTEYLKTWFSASDLADFGNNRGVLAYSVVMARIDAFVPGLDAYHTFSNCFVNAQTGSLMAEYITTGLMGGGDNPRRIMPFTGELDAGPITLVSGKKSLIVQDASTTRIAAPRPLPIPAGRSKLTIKRGKLFIHVEFDPSSKLLRIAGKVPVWVRPNSKLLLGIETLNRKTVGESDIHKR